MINFLSPRTNFIETVWLFVRSLNVKISYTTIEKEIMEHPFYPSLLSISEVLSVFGIKNVTAKFANEKILEIPAPFLIQLKGNNVDNDFFSVVRENNKTNIEYYDPKTKKWKLEDKEFFVRHCTGIVLIAEVTCNSGEREKKYRNQDQSERKILYIQYLAALFFPFILSTLAIIGFLENKDNIGLTLIFSVFYLIGSGLTFLLILNDIDHYNPVVQVICGAGKKINCNAVLGSSGAKIFGISWSTIGFTYFFGGLIYILTTSFEDKQPLGILWQLNLLGSLYIFYSVYYQWKIVKNWCSLCLSVLLIILLITLLGFVDGLHHFTDFSLYSLTKLLVTLFLPFVASTMLYLISIKTKKYKNGQLEFQRLKLNPDFFKKNLSNQKPIIGTLEGLGIVLGNPNATNKIIKVCNPYCSPCSLIHESIKELLNISDNLAIQIIFTVTNNTNDIRYYPVRHFLALVDSKTIDVNQALDDWYNSKDKSYETFSSKYPINTHLLDQQNEKLEAMGRWCRANEVSFTPTFFINGYQLPSTYNIWDVRYYILD
ncbi:vitamin K epoxide reductase family protein [Sphingobacterium thalpophilum]|uniref:vitamin K epoxide reductase family protein n=1 Tax=Sphingobacterium thalpophilum TaxID=259 RepID=UPI0031E3DB00